MATIEEFKSCVRATFPVQKEMDDAMFCVVDTPGGRSQVVSVQVLGGPKTGYWAAIESPIGSVHQIDIVKLLQAARWSLAGGIVADGAALLLRDTFPIANLDLNELVQPFIAITAGADLMEELFTGTDRL